jgi:hypothetical protein
MNNTPGQMTDLELAGAYARCDEVEKWCHDTRAETMQRALAGRTIHGYKLVEGRQGNRAWSDNDAIANALALLLPENAVYMPRVVNSPTAIEKLMSGMPAEWAAMESYITRSAGKPTLVISSDKRPAIIGGMLFPDVSLL